MSLARCEPPWYRDLHLMAKPSRVALLAICLACVGQAYAAGPRFAECQVDLVEQQQPAGCVSVVAYTALPTSGGSVESDCGKLAAFARGSGARGVRSSVSRNPQLPGFQATCR